MITTIGGFITKLSKQYREWNSPKYMWFRGEPNVETRLTPKLYRPKPDGSQHHENKLLQMFRMKAPSFAPGSTPSRERIDEWLFLAQHVGLPTRLLDWTENSLLALYFALKQDKPVVWMLDPMALNAYVKGSLSGVFLEFDEFPLTWFRPNPPAFNIGHENIHGAWERDKKGLDLPVAVHPTYIHPRMNAQRSGFTVHGRKKEPLDALLPATMIAKFEISNRARKVMLNDLAILGIQESSAFPDLDGLAKELATNY
jgi:hypothetical protein